MYYIYIYFIYICIYIYVYIYIRSYIHIYLRDRSITPDALEKMIYSQPLTACCCSQGSSLKFET